MSAEQPATTRSSSNTSLSSGSSNEDKNIESNKSDKSSDSGDKVTLREKPLDNSKESKDKRKSWKEKRKISPVSVQVTGRYAQ